MDYEFWFYVSMAFNIILFISKLKFYIGDDREKFKAADIGIKLRPYNKLPFTRKFEE